MNSESGLPALYTTPIETDFGIFWYTSKLTGRIITPGGTGRFGGDEPSSLVPMGVIAVGRFELQTVTSLLGRMKTPPNPTGVATNPYEWRQLQQQLSCMHGHMVDSINHLVWLLTTGGGVLMSINLADQAMSRNYGALRAKAEAIITGLGVSLRCTALDATGVRPKPQEGKHRVDLPDISPGRESNFVLARTLDHKNHRDQVFIHESRGRSDKSNVAAQGRPEQGNLPR